ncbi:hypothetical protein OESDEN_17027 [Oesophagostomum dentatum]|uniref:Uncharacterized protein n=1 Tax=Oesophagostomum dentatum TaxID=61180 RepID=A0A0B1SHB1_OESDE|nr:hypothetical protein OESDEN_17027 [Oesophagostomum dentatum]
MPLAAYFTSFTYNALDKTKVAFGGWTGEVVTADMCVAVLRSLLSQDAEFYDRPQRSNAACVAELTSKAQDVLAVSKLNITVTEQFQIPFIGYINFGTS